MVKKQFRYVVWFVSLLWLSGFSVAVAVDAKVDSIPEETKLLSKLYTMVSNKMYSKATGVLDDLTLDYQASKQHAVYQMEAMYVNFMNEDYEKVASIADAYLVAYPYAKHVDYAMYMQALSLLYSYTADIDNTMQSFMHLGEHDTTGLEKAKEVLDDFLIKYPDSVYYADAAQLYKTICDKLMANDFEVAKQYSSRKAFFASQDRLLRVLRWAYNKDAALSVLKVMEANYKAMRLDAAANIVKGIILLNK